MAPRAARLRRTQSAGSTSSSSTATTSSSEPGNPHDPPVKHHHGHGRSNPDQSLIHIIVTSRVLKYALAAGGLTILLLIFAATWKQEAPGGCHMCMHGDGLVHEAPLFDDSENVDEELEDGDGGPLRSSRTNHGHRQVCPRLYHERQQSRLDLLHSFNNLLQGDNVFTKEEMDALADGLEEPTRVMPSVFKKHYNIFTGNYDLQVLMAAAASRGKDIVISTRENYMDTLDIARYRNRLIGLIVHVRRRTWVALKHIEGFWYNLDSTNGTPLLFCEGEKDMLKFLNWILHDDGEVVTILNPALPEPPVVFTEKRHFTSKLRDWKNNWF